MTPDPNLSTDQIHALRSEVSLCNRLLLKLWEPADRERMQRRRRQAFRVLFDIPQAVILPLDWQP